MVNVKKRHEFIWRSSRISEWFRVELGGVQKVQNLKSRLKKHNLNVFPFLKL